jgi:hypothetical protein
MVRAGAGARIFDKPEPELEPEKMDRLRNTDTSIMINFFQRLVPSVLHTEQCGERGLDSPPEEAKPLLHLHIKH